MQTLYCCALPAVQKSLETVLLPNSCSSRQAGCIGMCLQLSSTDYLVTTERLRQEHRLSNTTTTPSSNGDTYHPLCSNAISCHSILNSGSQCSAYSSAALQSVVSHAGLRSAAWCAECLPRPRSLAGLAGCKDAHSAVSAPPSLPKSQDKH